MPINNADLYGVVKELGEDVEITQTLGGNKKKIKARLSVVPATKAAYNMIDRAFLLWGNIASDTSFSCVPLEGAYLKRAIEPNATYLVYSIIPNAGFPNKLGEIYCSRCTDIVTVKRKKDSIDSEWGYTKTEYITVEEDICAAFNTATRSGKITKDGTFDHTIYNCVLPARFKVSKGDHIIKKSFVNGELTEEVYEVESAMLELVHGKDDGEIYGIASYQLIYHKKNKG